MSSRRIEIAQSAGQVIFNILAFLLSVAVFVFVVLTFVHLKESTTKVAVENFPMMSDVNVKNFPANQEVTVTNFPPTPEILNVNVTNFPPTPEVLNVSVDNFPPPPSNQNVTITNPDDISLNIDNVTINADVQVVSDVNATIYGINEAGDRAPIRVTAGSHISAVVAGPVASFGSVLTESLIPVFQLSAVYGVNPQQILTTTSGDGTVTEVDASFNVRVGPTPYSVASLQSRKRVTYRPGQGTRMMFSGKFDVGATNVTQVVGMGTTENGVYFAQRGTQFGILYTSRGIRESRILTITTGSSTAESVVVTLNDVVFNVPVTNSGNIQRTVYEISQFAYAGWSAEPFGSTIRFLRLHVGPTTGSYSFSATTAVGSFALNHLGKATEDEFIPQTLWNQDKLDGTGPSGILLDPTKFNVYVISMQYLGAGPIRFHVETVPGAFKETQITPVHTIVITNNREKTSFSNPHFPATVAVISTNTEGANVTLQSASMGGFVEGAVRYRGNRFSFSNTLASSVGTSNCQALLSLRNSRLTNGRTNQGVVTLASVSAAVKHTQPVTLFLYRSADTHTHNLGGNPNFQSTAQHSGILVDTQATTFTPITAGQQVWTSQLAETGSATVRFFDSGFESISIEPGETLTLCARSTQATASYVSGSLTVREDN